MKVFFNPKMSTPSHGYSPSGSKPAAAVADWQQRGLDIEIVDFEPATEADLCLAHDPKFVKYVLTRKINNGHGNKIKRVTDSCLWTNGSIIASAKAAITERITCSPSSGHHHSHRSSAGGFCTFNGLCVAAIKAINEGLVSRVGIVDCDAHWFDGVVDIIDRLELHDIVKAWSFGGQFGGRRSGFRQDDLLQQLGETLAGMKDDGVELIIYQAGADPYVNDPLCCGGGMTIEELRERDQFVFTTCQELGLATTYTHAGGYAKDEHGGISEVLEIHRNTALEALKVLSISTPRENSLPSTPTAATTTRKRTHIRDTTMENLGKGFAFIGGIKSPPKD